MAACAGLGLKGLRGGQIINLESDSPLWVKQRAEEDAEQCMWRQAASRHAHMAHLDGGPYLEAVKELLDEGSLTVRQTGLSRAFLPGAFFRSTECICGESFDDALAWWGHFAWSCPGTQGCRLSLTVPQHTGRKSLEGLPEEFAEKIVQFAHLPWIRTALLPDPRARLPGPADPAIMRWRVPDGSMAAFSGDCIGDESCSVDGKLRPQHNRAGWAVVEAGRELNGAMRLGRSCAGTLPGPDQTSEGAAVYALLSWLRHLDPTSRVQPRLFLDDQRTVDGWHRRWDTSEPWAPHRDLCLQVENARADNREDMEVVWMKGHTLRGAAGRC